MVCIVRSALYERIGRADEHQRLLSSYLSCEGKVQWNDEA